MKTKSAKSINQWQSVIQTTNDIVKAHGGSINIHSNPGKTVFMITLTI
jgi:nitrogen-specific signal transduction histidine kinase